MSEPRYLVSARKYRPQVFGELVGQEHVAETLRNAIRLDRLAHAYLFSGPRGVGKTTAARILAKAINCETSLEDRPGAEPCRACESCRSFEEGRSLNIIEIDAASNNKVDDIRELRETVRVPPQGARRKVYILDEVHMLSTGAFNALLKTLEEPPPYVLFIFGTTEPHKVLPTILSRCQRFDFRRISAGETAEQLRKICEQEGIEADEASLLLLARKGDGALRDALSAFDQAIALCGTTLRYAELASALGVVEIDLYFEVTAHVRERSAPGMLGLVDRLVRRGYDLQEFLVGLQEHVRNLLVARTMPDVRLIEASLAVQERYANEAEGFHEADLLRLLALVAEAEEALKASTQPRLRLELTLLKATALASARDLNAALAAVERLEALAREGGGQMAEGRADPAPRADPATRTAPRYATAEASRVREPEPARPEEPARAAEYALAEPAARGPRPLDATSTPSPLGPQPFDPGPPPVPPADYDEHDAPALPEPPDPAPAEGPRVAQQGPLSPTPRLTESGLFSAPAIRPRAARGPQNTAALAAGGDGGLAVAVAPEATAGADHAAVERAWRALPPTLARGLAALVAQSDVLGLEAGTLSLGVPTAYHGRALDEASGEIGTLLRGAHGLTVQRLRCTVRAAVPAAEAGGTVPAATPYDAFQKLRQDHPVARAILDQFGGEPVY